MEDVRRCEFSFCCEDNSPTSSAAARLMSSSDESKMLTSYISVIAGILGIVSCEFVRSVVVGIKRLG